MSKSNKPSRNLYLDSIPAAGKRSGGLGSAECRIDSDGDIVIEMQSTNATAYIAKPNIKKFLEWVIEEDLI